MPSVVFHPMEADASNYPKPEIPMLAPLTCASWNGRQTVDPGSAFLNGGESFIYGRYALAEAMRRAGVKPGALVLLPSFHCRVVVESALYLGASPHFYPLTTDLQPDFKALTQLLEQSPPPTALVLTHYFGFPNAAEEADQFCKAHGIVLIEDCAHALYGRTGGQQLGRVGSYSAASLWKFLPVPDGAVLLDNTGTEPPTIYRRAQPAVSELKALARVTEMWLRRIRTKGDPPQLSAPKLAAEARRIAARRVERAVDTELKEFSLAENEFAALSISQRLAPGIAHGRVAQKRRDNYKRWLDGMRFVTEAMPLFPTLPDHVVPYAFPLLTDSSGLPFHILKLAGIPMWRWEDMAVTDCPVANDYRLRLLQLPCHQELRSKELDWMIHTVQILLRELHQ